MHFNIEYYLLGPIRSMLRSNDVNYLLFFLSVVYSGGLNSMNTYTSCIAVATVLRITFFTITGLFNISLRNQVWRMHWDERRSIFISHISGCCWVVTLFASSTSLADLFLLSPETCTNKCINSYFLYNSFRGVLFMIQRRYNVTNSVNYCPHC